MKTTTVLRPLLLAVSMLVLGNAQAQVSAANNAPGLGSYVGLDNTVIFPLDVRTNANFSIDWYTNNVQRMMLNEQLTGQTIGIYTNLNLSGHLGVGPFNTNYVTVPFSLIHVDNGGNQFSGFRPWHKTGITLTEGTDLGYVGLKSEGSDVHSMTVCWADNSAQDGPDRLKFIFISNQNSANGTAGSLNGLEAARITPANGGDESFFGFGDWFFTGGNVDPTERVDLLDGSLRIRQLPTETATLWNQVMVVDNTGVVHWRDAASIGGNDQDWFSTQANDVVTAWPNGMSFPEAAQNVGIGLDEPRAKLDVLQTELEQGGLTAAIRSVVVSGDVNNIAVDAYAIGEAENANFGVRAIAMRGVRNYGVYSQAIGGEKSPVGVYGYADGQFQSIPIGVWGVAVNTGPTGGPGWAGWFDGKVWSAQGYWSGSDEMFKENITDITDASIILEQLAPKTYTYNVTDYGYLGFEEGNNFGLIAQDVEAVIPDLVKDVTRPARTDSMGSVIEPETTYKGINYDGFIPLLIQGFKEQQAIIEEQGQRLAQMEQAINDCCKSSDVLNTPNMNNGDDGELKDAKGQDVLGIDPNPFNEQTTLSYTLKEAGQLSLQVANSLGVNIATLEKGMREAGSYQYVWNTGHLAPGTYFVSVLLNGVPLVKRGVKIR